MSTVPHRGRALAVLVACLFLVQLDTMLLSVAASVLFQPEPVGLGLTQGEFLWVTSAYTLTLTGVLLLAGWLGDHCGRRTVLLAGMGVFAAASVACALGTTSWHLVAGRAVLGIGAALASPNTLATLVSMYPGREERARAVGLWSTAVGVALAVGPIVAGLLLDHYRWPALFWVNVPVALAAIAGLLAFVPNTRGSSSAAVDIPGIVLSLGGLALVVHGVLRGGDTGEWLNLLTLGSVALGLVVLAAFVACEGHTRHPMLDVRRFRSPAVTRSVILSAVAFMAMSGVMFVVGLWLLVYEHRSPLQTGLLMLPLALGQFFLAPLGSRFVARFGSRAVASAGAVLLTAAFGAFLLVPRLGLLPVEVGMFTVGAALSLIAPTATVEIQSSIPPESAGAASAVNNLFRQVGSTLGGAVLGSLLASRYRADVGTAFDGLPAQARDAARQSLQACYAVLERFPATPEARALVPTLRETAEQAFRAGYDIATLVGCALGVVTVVTALGLPRRSVQHASVTQPPAHEGERARPAGHAVAP